MYNIKCIDVTVNLFIPKIINKISKSLYLVYIYIYIYIYIRESVYFQYKTSKTGKKTSKLYTTRYALLFVEPLFRYLFLPLLAHDNQTLESLFGSPIAGAHGGLTPQMNVMPVVQKNHSLTRRVIFGLL